MPPSVTVVVPVRNEGRSIESTLRSLLVQDYPRSRFEIVVADGGSTDETVPAVRRLQRDFPNLKLTYNADRYSSGGRNLGIRHMTGDYAVVVDGHCAVPDDRYLSQLVAAFETSGADSLGRPQPLDVEQPTGFQKAVSLARASRLGHNPESDIYSDVAKFVPPQSTAVAYRRDVFHQIGLFDGSFDACEDVEFNHRVYGAGMTCYFTPAVKIVYHPRGTWKGLFAQLARYGAGRARLARKTPHSLTLPALVPPLWLLWLVAGLPGVFLNSSFALVYVALLALYLTIIGAGSAWLGRTQPLVVRLRMPGVFLAIHFGFAWGFLREMMTAIGNKKTRS